MSLDSLSSQQLSAVKKQLDDEVEHLTGSFSQLHAAQAKFKECASVVKSRTGVAADGTRAPVASRLVPSRTRGLGRLGTSVREHG